MARQTHPLVVLETTRAAADQQLVVLDGRTIAAEYRRPGQVVEIEHEGSRAYAVLASTLAERPRLSLLLRVGRSPALDALADLPPGEPVWTSEPFGPGFPLETLADRRLWLCVAGTGIAAVRPVLHELASVRGVRLYYGTRTHEHVAFAAELDAFAERGLTIALCLSDAAPTKPGDRPGWVQDVIEAERPDLRDAVVLVAGPREMEERLRSVTAGLGLPEGSFLRNY